jgi:hypothetical protein
LFLLLLCTGGVEKGARVNYVNRADFGVFVVNLGGTTNATIIRLTLCLGEVEGGRCLVSADWYRSWKDTLGEKIAVDDLV